MLIRPFEDKDASAIAHIYVQTWQDTYLGLVPYGYLYGISTQLHELALVGDLKGKGVFGLVSEVAGRVVGFTSGGRERCQDSVYHGEIYTLYVLKHYQRKGIGRGLVAALAADMKRFGVYSMMVRVLAENPCRRFYESINGILLRTQRMPFAGEMLDVAAYGWIDTQLITETSSFPNLV